MPLRSPALPRHVAQSRLHSGRRGVTGEHYHDFLFIEVDLLAHFVHGIRRFNGHGNGLG